MMIKKESEEHTMNKDNEKTRRGARMRVTLGKGTSALVGRGADDMPTQTNAP